MSRSLRALLIVLLVASCGSSNYSAPHNMDNACSILTQRKSFIRAFKTTERRWGVPVHVQMATIYQESKFIANARTPLRFALGVIPMGRQSSAYGYSQALDGTWDEYRKETGKWGARRDDISDAADFMGWYMAGSRDTLGIPLTDTRSHYLAYHEGRSGFSRGSHRSKSWLMRVSAEVAQRADTYQTQLASCRAAR